MLTTKNRVRAAVAFPLVLLAVLTGCAPQGERALLKGQALLQQGKYAEALPKLRTATSLLVSNAVAWNGYGLACHHSGLPVEAEKAYQKAISLNRELAETRFNLGCLFLEQNRLDAAKSEFTAFTLRRPNAVDGYLLLGRTHAGLRELNSAEKAFAEALKIHPQCAEALNGLGLVRLQRGRPADAAAFFNGALKQQPNFAPAILNLAIVSQVYLRDRKLALQKYRDYLALNPSPAESNTVLATVRQLESELAPQRPRAIVSAPPPSAAAATNAVSPPPPVAQTTSSVPKTQATVPPAQPRVAVVSKPEPQPAAPKTAPLAAPKVAAATRSPATSAPVVAARPYENVTLPPEPALKSARDASETHLAARDEGSVANPVVTTSTVPSEAKVTRPAKKNLLKSLNPLSLFQGASKTPKDPTRLPPVETPGDSIQPEAKVVATPVPVIPKYHYLNPPKPRSGNHSAAVQAYTKGVQAQSAGKLPEAIQAYHAATKEDPDFFEAHYNLGLASAASGKLQEALTAYETALSIIPDSQEARFSFGVALQHANYPHDAAKELEKVIARYPNDARSRLTLGNIYAQQLQQTATARAHYLKLLELEPNHPQASAIRYWLAANP